MSPVSSPLSAAPVSSPCQQPSLRVLLLVEQDEPLVSVDRRGPDGGFTRVWHEGEDAVVPLPELGSEAELPLRELYAA